MVRNEQPQVLAWGPQVLSKIILGAGINLSLFCLHLQGVVSNQHLAPRQAMFYFTSRRASMCTIYFYPNDVETTHVSDGNSNPQAFARVNTQPLLPWEETGAETPLKHAPTNYK